MGMRPFFVASLLQNCDVSRSAPQPQVLARLGLHMDLGSELRDVIADEGLMLSPPTAITLSETERHGAGIPMSAVVYSFSYPLRDPMGTLGDLERACQNEGGAWWGVRNFVSWLRVGGFVYSNASGTVVAVNCVQSYLDPSSVASVGERGSVLYFGSPLHMPDKACVEIEQVGSPSLSQSGVLISLTLRRLPATI